MKYILIVLMLIILSCGPKPSQEATEDTGTQETQETSEPKDDGKTHARLTSINEDVICEYGHITDCGIVLKHCNTGQSYYCFKDVVIK